MTQLPERPNLGQLKRQAKDLLRAVKARDAAALARLRTLPAFAHQRNDDALAASAALHDAQSVIAREHGFPSWNALGARVEELTPEAGDAVTQFIEAATDGRPDRAARLLALHPDIAHANFYTALLMGDADAVAARLTERPSLASDPGGSRGWLPLVYVCHTALGFGPPHRGDGLVAVARRLLASGADPNTRVPWIHHGVYRPVLWSAVCVAHLLPLAEVLLAAGADPNDGVTLVIAAGGGDVTALDLLYAHGADVNQPWATDGSAALYAILTWSESTVGAQWLLDHGADPDPVFPPNGETPLHAWRAVGRRSSRPSSCGAALIRHGRDWMDARRTPWRRCPETRRSPTGSLCTEARATSRRSTGSSPRAAAVIGPALRRCSPRIRRCATRSGPSTTARSTAPPSAEMPSRSTRCWRAASIRTTRTMTWAGPDCTPRP